MLIRANHALRSPITSINANVDRAVSGSTANRSGRISFRAAVLIRVAAAPAATTVGKSDKQSTAIGLIHPTAKSTPAAVPGMSRCAGGLTRSRRHSADLIAHRDRR
jgi:hypothetical protein